jgi:cGMP-dependent protein kinase
MKLINFHNSKKLIKRTDTTLTLVGLPHYIAPELILGESHGIGADYWSLGVCIYELMVGGFPFGDFSSNPIEIYEEIIKGDL